VSAALRHIRHEVIVGRHLYNAHPDSRVRAQGWKRIQDAKRICRRLQLPFIFDL
jgi:hypothetical protein